MKKLILVVMAICLVALTLVGCAGNATSSDTPEPEKKTISITDSAGRQVEIPQPLKRIVVINSGLEVIRILGETDKVVGITSISDPNYYPEFKDTPVVRTRGGVSYEKIIELNPDVVFAYASPRYSDLSNLEEKLASTDIKIVALDFFKPSTLAEEIRTLGLMFGKEEKADEYINFYQGYLNTVKERVEKLKNDEKKRVFYESCMSAGKEGAFKTAAEGSGFHDLIVMAGGINIFADAGTPYPVVSAEEVLTRNPQVVLRSDLNSKNLHEMEALRNELISRSSWSNLDAVKNNKVYIISTEFTTSGIRKTMGICHIAKWLYPELFADLDTQAFQDKLLEYQTPGVLERALVYP